MADPERDGAGVQLREIAVQQIFHDRLLTRREYLLWDLLARLERAARERHFPACACQLELQPAAVRQHDEAALGTGDFDRRVEHERQNFVEHPAHPSARSPSSSTAICRNSPAAEMALRSTEGASSLVTNVTSVSPACPKRRRSPGTSTRSVTRSPLINVPKRDCLSCSVQMPSSTVISA